MNKILFPALIAGLFATACGGSDGTGGGGSNVGGAGGDNSSSSKSSTVASTGSQGGNTSNAGGGGGTTVSSSGSGKGGAGGAGGAGGSGGIGGVQNLCGNGTRDVGEDCDDGNSADGDGCSATCAVEHGYHCDTMSPNVCATTCGDGVIAGAEACDDGNTAVDDGCSATCTLEAGYGCMGEPSTCTLGGTCASPIKITNGFTFVGTNFGKFMDDLNFTDSSCLDVSGTPNASPDVVFKVDLLAGQTLVSKNFGTLDLVWQVVQTCAVGACLANYDSTPGVGSGEQTHGLQFTATTAGTYYIVVESYRAGSAIDPMATYDLRFSIPACGNGVVEVGETCDDGNVAAMDGCSPTCAIESGFDCAGNPSVCTPIPAASCADPIVVSSNPFELSGVNFAKYGDDADFSTGTSCQAHASSTPNGYDVVFKVDLVANETVRVRQLGTMDGLLHILTAGSCGAGTACVASTDADESGGITYTAPSAQTVYVVVESWGNPDADDTYDIIIDKNRCGDGVVSGQEICDDGNNADNDGCSATCQAEPGFICTGAPSACVTNCTDVTCALGPCTGGTIVTATATGLPKPIPDNDEAGGALVTLDVPNTGTISRMVMTFGATHTYDSDIHVNLKGPTGSEIDISSDNGSSGDNYVGTIFADGTSNLVTDGTAPFTGVYAPQTPLATFAGRAVHGTWTVRVADDAGSDTGTVDAVGLTFCVMP